MKKSIISMVLGVLMIVADGAIAASTLPPASKLVIGGANPEVVVKVKDGKAAIAIPILQAQIDKNGGKKPSFKLNQSTAHYSGDWVLKSAEKYETNTTNAGESIETQYPLPKEGCDWVRIWGDSPDAGHLWISQTSKYYRSSENGSPGYEFVICADAKVSPVPKDYHKRP